MQKMSFSIRELAERARKEGAYDLAQGVIDASPPKILVDTLKSLPIEEYSNYNNKRGVPIYREAITSYLNSREWSVSIDNVMATAGVMGGITSALLTHCNPGDKVLLPEPFFVYHRSLIELLGLEPVFFRVPLDSEPNWNQLKELMASVQALILTSPANPTGQVAPSSVLKKLSLHAKETDCLLILDEIYREFVWEEKEPNDLGYNDIDPKNTVILRSFSKTLAIPGWRCGFAVTTPERIEAMATKHDNLYIGGSTLAQNALAVTLNDHRSELNQYIATLRTQLLQNQNILSNAFSSYGMAPLPVTATYYMLLKHSHPNDIEAMEELISKKVVTTPVNILFSDTTKNTGYIRIHFGVSPQTTRGVEEILLAA